MLIASGTLEKNCLDRGVVLVTGAGRGIGFEAARALLWLGARVALAEVDRATGHAAAARLSAEFGGDSVLFVPTDLGDEGQVRALVERCLGHWGRVDAVLNNAAALPMGAVAQTSLGDWDRSYGVNLRAPVLLAQAFIPGMLARRHGAFVCVSSSGAAPFMGPYEVFKTAQVELANTLSAELEGTGVHAFAIGPGIVETPGFLEGGGKVAALMGITTRELLEMNRAALLTPEAAGVGFACALALAERYHGSEVSSLQVLRDVGISVAAQATPAEAGGIDWHAAGEAITRVLATYAEQSEGWKRRNLFERQWVARDFKKNTGMSIDELRSQLEALGRAIDAHDGASVRCDAAAKLAAYYRHQQQLLKGFEKDPERVEKNLRVIDGWLDEIHTLATALRSPG